MDAKDIVKAMEEAGVMVVQSNIDPNTIRGTATAEEWSRFRGIQVEEVEKAMSDEFRGVAPEHAAAIRIYWLGVMRRLRGGDS